MGHSVTTRRPGIREVAQRAGVGAASVSRVLSNHPEVSDRMRHRVLAAVAELGYEPDIVARGLRSRTTSSVGFVLSDISNPLLSAIVRGAEAVLRAAGYSMLLTNSEDSPDLDARHLRQLRQRRVDGLILLPAAEDDASTLRQLSSIDVPAVIIDRDLPPDLTASYVLSDHRSGMRDAVEDLLQLGHRRFAIVLGRNVRPSRERLSAVQHTIATASGTSLAVEAGTLSVTHGREALQRLLNRAKPHRPSAVILGGNQLLVGALETIRAHQVRLGADLSLISCDDVPLARLFQPPISVVARDPEQTGRAAAELLLGQITHKGGVDTIVLPTWYTPRQSHGTAT
ncbi:MAG: LacI family DNA-binding transcriptional regulator [Carbonactinosporaceae bacterium]